MGTRRLERAEVGDRVVSTADDWSRDVLFTVKRVTRTHIEGERLLRGDRVVMAKLKHRNYRIVLKHSDE